MLGCVGIVWFVWDWKIVVCFVFVVVGSGIGSLCVFLVVCCVG